MSQINYLHQIIDLLATNKSQYLTQPCPMNVKYDPHCLTDALMVHSTIHLMPYDTILPSNLTSKLKKKKDWGIWQSPEFLSPHFHQN